MNYYAHQQEVIDEKDRPDRLRFCNFRGTGSGKTRTTVAIAEGPTLVICPKTQADEQIWEKEWHFQKRTYPLVVLSKEKFKKLVVENRDQLINVCGFMPVTVIIDEAHTVAGIQPETRQKNYQQYPKTSQIYAAVVHYLDHVQPKRIYPLTATPAASPMSLYGLGRIIGKNWDYWQFREAFYYRTKLRGWERWLPKFRRKIWPGAKPDVAAQIMQQKKASIELAAKTIESLGYTGTLQDWFDVPDQTFKTHVVGATTQQEKLYKELKKDYPDPLVQAGKRQRLEQGLYDVVETTPDLATGEVLVDKYTDFVKENKTAAIEEYQQQFGRVVVFARYTAQIDRLAKHFKDLGVEVFVLTGATKDRKATIEAANASKECVFLAQCQISAGWELPDFPCMIFASLNYSFVDYDQAKGRILRANNLKKNLYVFLITGNGDKMVKQVIDEKQDFSESHYAEELANSKKL